MGILDILMWAFPAGCLGSAITWLLSRKTFNARGRREREDIYKTLYDNLGSTVLKIQEDNARLQQSNFELNEKYTRLYGEHKNIKIVLQTIVRRAVHCNHWRVCPLRCELQKYKLPDEGEPNATQLGLTDTERNAGVKLRAGPEEDGDVEPECGGSE